MLDDISCISYNTNTKPRPKRAEALRGVEILDDGYILFLIGRLLVATARLLFINKCVCTLRPLLHFCQHLFFYGLDFSRYSATVKGNFKMHSSSWLLTESPRSVVRVWLQLQGIILLSIKNMGNSLRPSLFHEWPNSANIFFCESVSTCIYVTSPCTSPQFPPAVLVIAP